MIWQEMNLLLITRSHVHDGWLAHPASVVGVDSSLPLKLTLDAMRA